MAFNAARENRSVSDGSTSHPSTSDPGAPASDVRELRTAGGVCPSGFAPSARRARARTVLFAPGDIIGTYRMQAVLGRGTTTVVARAFDTRHRRTVALKLVGEELAVDDAAALLDRAEGAQSIDHPNVIHVLEVGEHRGTPFVALELSDALPMRRFVGVSIPMAEALRWLLDVADGLDAAHRAGVIGCNIKPTNILVRPGGGAKITPFAEPTRLYMAPEQLAGDLLDARVDQFAWGLVACELLFGVHPRGAGVGVSAPARLPHLADLPPELGGVVRRALAPKPEARFATMRELAEALRPLVAPAPSGPASPPAARPAAPSGSRERAPADPDLVAALVQSAIKDIRRGVGEFHDASAVVIVTDIGGTRDVAVRLYASDSDDVQQSPSASVDTRRIAERLVVDNQSGARRRFRTLIVPIGKSGLDPRRSVEAFS